MRLPLRLLHRKLNSNKSDFGHVLVLAGSARFSGAAVLCAEAAMRAGAGLVTIGIPKSINTGIIKIKPKEIMTLPLAETIGGALSLKSYRKIKEFVDNIDVLAIGPGLSLDASTQALVRKIIIATDKPIVIDADGLGALAGHLKSLCAIVHKPYAVIMTPHPGEMAKLLKTTVKNIQDNREAIAKKFAGEHKITLVLKGHKTIVAGPIGKLYINKTGNPGMSTAGSGDVLTGIIAAFLAQGLSSFEAAKYGVYLHGLAGDLAAKEKTELSLISSDIIDKIPKAVKVSIKDKRTGVKKK